ncbi:MAG: chorismate synthase [Legionellales bacterium]|jgi:chorismate synthase
MASNSFGDIFRITTWGESHGKAIGVVIDGCPAGLEINEDEINTVLARRAPGRAYTTPRVETDNAQIYSGVFEGKTTGTPISIIIHNKDADSSQYASIKNLLRPGHANYTYIEKYGIFDYRGGGRASARETACRVAAGAIATKILNYFGVQIAGYIKAVGDVSAKQIPESIQDLQTTTLNSPLFCPDQDACERMRAAIQKASEEGDSLGGVIEFRVDNLPAGLGDPVYEKLEANLAKAMLGLPATKGFEIGEGFAAASMQGSTHNDAFVNDNGVRTQTNRAGGTLGGISTGMPLLGRVAFKPTSSIKKTQQTVDLSGNAATFKLPENARHDPCVAIRAVPIVEAMCALVLVDALLRNRSAQL